MMTPKEPFLPSAWSYFGSEIGGQKYYRLPQYLHKTDWVPRRVWLKPLVATGDASAIVRGRGWASQLSQLRTRPTNIQHLPRDQSIKWSTKVQHHQLRSNTCRVTSVVQSTHSCIFPPWSSTGELVVLPSKDGARYYQHHHTNTHENPLLVKWNTNSSSDFLHPIWMCLSTMGGATTPSMEHWTMAKMPFPLPFGVDYRTRLLALDDHSSSKGTPKPKKYNHITIKWVMEICGTGRGWAGIIYLTQTPHIAIIYRITELAEQDGIYWIAISKIIKNQVQG